MAGKGRAPCCDKSKVKRGPWSPAEDLRLITFIQKHGHSNWRALPKQAGLLRCGKSCRLRWINYLRPDLKRGSFSPEEEETIIKLHQTMGNKWSKIASYFPGRTDNEIKNVWNTHLKKRLAKKGDDRKNKDETGKDFCRNSSFSQSSSSTSSISREENSPNEILGGDQLMTDILENETNEIPLECDMDFWRILDVEDPLQSNEPLTMDPAVSENSKFIVEEDGRKEELEYKKWFKNLENELGLDQMTNEVIDQSSTVFDEAAGQQSGKCFFEMWLSSSQSFEI